MEQRLAELHIVSARSRAFRLLTAASTILPDEWGAGPFTEMVIIDLVEFALHARRVSDICGFKGFNGASATRFKMSENQESIVFMDNYDYALNRVIHTRTLKAGYTIWEGTKIFTGSTLNKVFSYVVASSDKYPAEKISIFGLATCFLTKVISRIKNDFPQFSF